MGPIAICKILYSLLRTEPNHRAEICSQLVFGEWVVIVATNEDWAQVKTEHGYIGWCRIAHMFFSNETETGEISEGLPGIVTKSDRVALHHLSLNSNDFLPPYLQEGCFSFFPSQLPNSGLKWLNLNGDLAFEPMEMVAKSQHFIGIPYLWGGKTPFGFDCSGFVQFLVNLQGFSYPRDAWQQAEIGDKVPFNQDAPEFEPGTLLFFQHGDKKVHHVAISIGGSEFVHASEWTRIQSFNPENSTFAEDRKKSLSLAKIIRTENLTPLLVSFEKLIRERP